MPGLSGLEFVERLRDMPQGKDIPVLMISADVNEELRGKGERLGVAGFLAKPVAKAELLEKAQQLMRR
jgi:CheY-like chemotaxis protein